jgi:hypothetical protein
MKHALLLITSVIYFNTVPAQVNNKLTGVYNLTGVMETASGFKLNPDSTFEFYFSYGALDRYGSGNYQVKNGSILFNSKPYSGRDFKLVDSSMNKNNFTTIKVYDQKPAFNRFVYCLLKTPHGDSLINADDEGIITLPVKTELITLLFKLSPERSSTFVVDSKKANNYTFNFEPWIMEVFFKDFSLQHQPNKLIGKLPLLKDGMYSFIKGQ